jgi:hypothetical protein
MEQGIRLGYVKTSEFRGRGELNLPNPPSVRHCCASKWRILDKVIVTKVDTGMEIVKCIALLHYIIIDIEGLHDLSAKDVAAWTQMAVLSSKNAECIAVLPLLPNKRKSYFVNFSTVQLFLYGGKWKQLETCSNSHHYNM